MRRDPLELTAVEFDASQEAAGSAKTRNLDALHQRLWRECWSVFRCGSGTRRGATHPQLCANRTNWKMDEPFVTRAMWRLRCIPPKTLKLAQAHHHGLGLIHGVRPVVRPAVFVSHRDFDRVWSLAMSWMLKHTHIVPTKPRYHSAKVLNISFSTHPEE